MQCARCCKWTNTVKQNRKYAKPRIEFLIAVLDIPVENFSISKDHDQFRVRHVCKQLQPDKTCGIYEDRPGICRRYNCFEMANKHKRLPEGYEEIMKLINKTGQQELQFDEQI
jgi:Fe-S-cluster containining protein